MQMHSSNPTTLFFPIYMMMALPPVMLFLDCEEFTPLTLNNFLFCMDQNYQMPFVAGQNQQYYSRSTQNMGVPANSRLIHEPLTYNPPNNYIISSQAQQYYPPAQNAALTIPSTVYQNSAGPRISYSSVTPSAGLAYQEGGQLNSFAANSHKVMRSRLVPVTQYVPVYEYEDAPPPSAYQNTSIHQRIILHEPQNFQERIIYDEKLEAHPTMVEEAREVEAPVQATSPRIVKVSQDPLVETVPGNWKSRLDVGASRTSYAPPPPLPREEKPCCSGWLLLLLGLLALGGLLTAILLAKNSSSEQINNSNQATVSGTKVSAAPTKVSTVQPLTDAKIKFVNNGTAVASPLPVSSLLPQTVRPVEAVIPTDITKVAVTTPSTLPNTQVQPEKVGFMPVKPIVISNPSVAVTQPYIAPTVAVGEPEIEEQAEKTVFKTKVSSAVPVAAVPAKVEPVEVTTAATQPITIQPSAVKPASIQPYAVEPVTFQPSTAQTETVKVSTVQPQATQSSSVQPSLVQPQTVKLNTIQPSIIQPSIIQPYSIQPIAAQPTTIQPNYIQPTLIQPSAVQPGAIPASIQAVPYQPITISKPNSTTPTLLPSQADKTEQQLAEKALLASKNGFLTVAEVKDN